MDKQLVRRRQRLFKYAVDIFVEMLEQITKKRSGYQCNKTDISCFEKYMNHFGDNIGEEFVRKYCEYQMQSWFNDGAEKDYGKTIRFSWLFGEKAIKRWHKYDISTNVYLTRKFLKKDYNVNTVKIKTEINDILLTVRDLEEYHKKLYLNTKKGLAWCIANTTLYFHKSMNCSVCNFKNDCKSILREEYNKAYKLRGYGE